MLVQWWHKLAKVRTRVHCFWVRSQRTCITSAFINMKSKGRHTDDNLTTGCIKTVTSSSQHNNLSAWMGLLTQNGYQAIICTDNPGMMLTEGGVAWYRYYHNDTDDTDKHRSWCSVRHKTGVKWTPLSTPFQQHYLTLNTFIDALCITVMH